MERENQLNSLIRDAEIAMRKFSHQPKIILWLFHTDRSGQVMTFKNQINNT
jgi:hypothetical protein